MNWIKQPTHAGFWAWRLSGEESGEAYTLFSDSEKLWAVGNAEFGPCDEWGGEWAELVPVEEQQKAQADAAAMREALESLVRFRCECSGGDKCGHCKARSALSGNAGRELLAELQRLRSELKSAREEVERAKADRNKSGVEERRKYLPKIQELTADLAKAQSQCAAMKSVLEQVAEIEVHGQPTALALQAASALSPDCGRDYVHRSEVDMLKIEVQKMASQEMKEGTVRFVATRVS